MFKKLQMKMTLTYTFILIAVLLVTNTSIYVLMKQYNAYQLSDEVQQMLKSIRSSEWLYEKDQANKEESRNDSDDDADLLAIPKAPEIMVPQTLNSFEYYMIYNIKGIMVKSQFEDESIYSQLKQLSSTVLPTGIPKVIHLKGIMEHDFLVGKMTIIAGNQTLGECLIAKDVTMAYDMMKDLLRILIVSFIAGTLISVCLGYLLAGRAIRPIKESYASKQTFLANASHELKTPLSVILLSTEVLETELPEDDFQRQVVADIKEEATQMSNLVSQLLLLARGDSSPLLGQLETLNFSEILNDEVVRYSKMAQGKAISLEAAIAPELKHDGDLKLIQSVFSILIDNAIKYTHEGGSVFVTLKGHEHRKGLEFIIRDTGEGISKEHLDKIFERFYRVESSRSKETGGYGLGLSIAKEIVERHGGQIRVESQLGVGTTFTVSFM